MIVIMCIALMHGGIGVDGTIVGNGAIVAHLFCIGMTAFADGIRVFIIQIMMIACSHHHRHWLRSMIAGAVLAQTAATFHICAIRCDPDLRFQTRTALLTIRCGRGHCLIGIVRLFENRIGLGIHLLGRINALVRSTVILLYHVVLAGAKFEQIGRGVF